MTCACLRTHARSSHSRSPAATIEDKRGDRPVACCAPACLRASLAGCRSAHRPGPLSLVGGCAAVGPRWALGTLGNLAQEVTSKEVISRKGTGPQQRPRYGKPGLHPDLRGHSPESANAEQWAAYTAAEGAAPLSSAGHCRDGLCGPEPRRPYGVCCSHAADHCFLYLEYVPVRGPISVAGR